MPIKLTKKIAIALAAISGGIYYCLQDPAILALFPAPWGTVIGKFIAGVTVGGVGYSMKPKADIEAPKE